LTTITFVVILQIGLLAPGRPSTMSAILAKRRRFDSPQQAAFLSLWRTYDKLRALEEELFSQFGLSPQQYNALRLLRSVHPRSIPTLALGQKLISRAPDMTRLLDKLEERKLIRRERAADNRRVVEVSISAAGFHLLKALATPVRECHQRQLGHLSGKELSELTRLLKLARQPHEDVNDPSSADERAGNRRTP
jgi:DNA-binding MarR family transcriptional regulator